MIIKNKAVWKLYLCIILSLLSLFVFLGASPWEGAASIAPDGELPGNGRYIATNSFPRNTVVDITNIETNKSTRVIVANGLESPGLLAVVSREAAEIIGMRSGSISRIRMTQPSDPIAYLRFTEGLTSGIPGYDSGNVITEEKYRETSDKDAGFFPGNDASSADAKAPTQYSMSKGSGLPPYVLEPEWGGRTARSIIDLPEYTETEEMQYTAANDELIKKAAKEEADKLAAEKAAKEEAEKFAAEKAAQEEKEKADRLAAEKAAKEEAERLAAEKIAKEEADRLAAEKIAREEAERRAAEKAAQEEAERLAIEKIVKEEANRLAAEKAAKEEADRLAAEKIAKEEADRLAAEKAAQEEAERLAAEKAAQEEAERLAVEKIAQEEAERLAAEKIAQEAIESIEQIVVKKDRDADIEYNLIPAPERPPQTDIYGIDPSYIIPGIVKSAPAEDEPVKIVEIKPDSKTDFSIPRIYGLDRGWYYVQIASMDTAESVKNTADQIDFKYKPKVYKDADDKYRILLGPLNQGESAAVLQRFRSIGYKDAFVRQGR